MNNLWRPLVSLLCMVAVVCLFPASGMAVEGWSEGKAAFRQGNYRRAITSFTKALVHIYNARGLALQNNGNMLRAIQDFDQAVRLMPSYAQSYANRGTVYFKMRQYRRAIQDYNRAIQLAPNNPYHYYGRSQVFKAMGQPNRARQDYDRGRRLEGN